MLKPRLVVPNVSAEVSSHEDLFVERYRLLLSWALGLTNGQRASAEDLLHDLFIQFTINQPDLDRIENLEGYLRTMLRNLHLSRLRRASVAQTTAFSFTDYDSVAIGLRAIDSPSEAQLPYDRIQVQDELRRICHYGCVRKESSKAGSVLILRFFHGYYPSEISLIMRAPGRAVRNWLMLARREARTYVEEPQRLTFMKDQPAVESVQTNYKQRTSDLVPELRETIFRSRHGACLKRKQIREVYQATDEAAIDSSVLAHVVSCHHCLDEVNHTLGLPLLSSRYPTDTLGPDKSSGGGDGDDGSGPTGAGSDGPEFVKQSRERRKEVIEHRPKELRVLVNGFQLGAQKISSERSELTLSVNVDEPVGFVEVVSEQGLRMALLTVDAPPGGLAEHQTRVALSDQRSLELNLHFGSTRPSLHVLYNDPTFTEEETASEIETNEAVSISAQQERDVPLPNDVVSVAGISDKSDSAKRSTEWKRVWQSVRRRFGASFWSRPSTVTAIFALILIAVAISLLRHHGPAAIPTATELLRQSALTEEANSARLGQVVHRTINFEERNSSGELITQRKIEIWQSAEKGIVARRLFDQHGRLLAGDWRRSDGVQTLYHHGARPQVQLAPEKRDSTALSFDNAWMLSPSAKEFSWIVKDLRNAYVEELANSYVISAQSADASVPSANKSGPSAVDVSVVSATIVLTRTDLHPTEQTLIIRRGNETRQYKFTETGFERKGASTVAPSVFEPEPELLSSAMPDNRNSKPENNPPVPDLRSPAPVTATAALEVEVLRLLHQAGADMGEQVTVTHMPDGRLHVEALVGTENRKSEILNALSSVAGNPAVRIDVNTVAEAVKRKPQSGTSSTPVVVESIGTATNTIPVETELRAFFGKRGYANEKLDNQVRQFSTRIVVRSREVLNHAWALRRLAQRFTPEQLRTLDSDARAKWLALVRTHASALQQDTRTLRQELAPIFSGDDGEGSSDTAIKTDEDLIRAIERLFAVCSANDQAINSAFAISPDTDKAAAMKSPKFWRSLREAEALAQALQR